MALSTTKKPTLSKLADAEARLEQLRADVARASARAEEARKAFESADPSEAKIYLALRDEEDIAVGFLGRATAARTKLDGEIAALRHDDARAELARLVAAADPAAARAGLAADAREFADLEVKLATVAARARSRVRDQIAGARAAAELAEKIGVTEATPPELHPRSFRAFVTVATFATPAHDAIRLLVDLRPDAVEDVEDRVRNILELPSVDPKIEATWTITERITAALNGSFQQAWGELHSALGEESRARADEYAEDDRVTREATRAARKAKRTGGGSGSYGDAGAPLG